MKVRSAILMRTVLRRPQAYGKVDEDGSRWLLGDHVGRMWLLVLSVSSGRVGGLRLEALGSTSPASTLSYLDNGVV